MFASIDSANRENKCSIQLWATLLNHHQLVAKKIKLLSEIFPVPSAGKNLEHSSLNKAFRGDFRLVHDAFFA